MKTDITRKEIAAKLGAPFTIRKVDFTDLARDSAYTIHVKDMPSLFTPEDLKKWKPTINALKEIKANHTYKGKHIIS